MGVTAVVANKNTKMSAARQYIAVWIEDESGKESTERCLLFTERLFSSLRRLDLPSCFDVSSMKPGRLYAMSAVTTSLNVTRRKELTPVVLLEHNGARSVYQLPLHKLEMAMRIAEDNPEDIPPRSALSDLMD